MHSKPGSIVVGVDGSRHSDRALHWAAQQAVAERRPLTLVHAVHSVTPAFRNTALVDPSGTKSVAAEAGQKVLDDARSKIEWTAPELEVHEVFELADPRDVLLQLSEDAAVLVVGSRGRGQVRSLLLGSVSVALVRRAHCPVVVARPENLGTVRNGIVVGVDATPESRPVLEFAYRQASLHDLPLTILDCVQDHRSGTSDARLVSPETPEALESEQVALAEATAGMKEKYPEVHVTTRFARGKPQEALVRLGGRMDLVVVGAHQDSRVSQALFGSVSVAVVENAICPVAVVPVSTAR
jgi:nucleotide-binding universal stress UspA family protein